MSASKIKLYGSTMPEIDPNDQNAATFIKRIMRIEHDLTFVKQVQGHTIKALREQMTHLRTVAGLVQETDECIDAISTSIDAVVTFARNRNENEIPGSLLRGVSSALWTIPGLNILFGAVFYGGSVIADWYMSERSELRLVEDLSCARAGYLDNISSNMRARKIEVELNKLDDMHDRFEKFIEWIVEREHEIHQAEVEHVSSDARQYGMRFLPVQDCDADASICFTTPSSLGPTHERITILDVKNNHINSMDIRSRSTSDMRYMNNDIETFVKNGRKRLNANRLSEETIPILPCRDDLINRTMRIYDVGQRLYKALPPEMTSVFRKKILQYLQGGTKDL